MKRLLVTLLLLLLSFACASTHAASRVLRDSIFDPNDPNNPSSWTDGNPGGSAEHTGGSWNTPGLLLDVSAPGVLVEVKIVIFARDQFSLPENVLENVLGYPMTLHVWSDGVQGGADSFFDNAVAASLPGHISFNVNSINQQGLITGEAFGTTGPPQDPNMFSTFLITMDLSGFEISLEGGKQYVASILQHQNNFVTGGGTFRQSLSDASGFEDLFQQFDTDPNLYPGFIASQLNFGFEQYAAKLTLGNGDFDGDDDVDGHDFLAWQRHVGGGVAPEQDANGDGLADGRDLNIWQATYGTSWASASSANATVPEPSAAALCTLAMLFFFHRRGRKGTQRRYQFSSSVLSVSSVVLFLTLTSSTHAASRVLRDSIFDPNDPNNPSSWTDGLGGGSTLHEGAYWATAAFVVDIPADESGILTEAQIVIFARDLDIQPENDLEDIYDFSMDFHLWSDGVQGGPDSFFDNAIGFPVGGHLAVSVNSTSSSVIAVEEFGNTGPASNPTMFTTYLVTIDLAGFGIALQSGEQYVAAVIDPNRGLPGRGALFRIIGSRATGFEDLFQQWDTPENQHPGFLASQHNNPFQQYAAKLTLGNGDFDGDDDVDGHDFLAWQRHVGGSVAAEQDANGDGLADGRDLNIWQATYGTSWASASSANTTVPEPSSAALCLLAMLFFCHRRGHRGRRGTQRRYQFSSSVLSVSSVVLFLTLTSSTHAASRVLRDSIFDPTDPNNPSSWTDGLGGGSTLHQGADWATSAFVVDVPVTESGILTEAQIVIFARDLDLNPENDLEDIYDFSMVFHLWSDGIQGGPDSFFDNAIGNAVAGHIAVSVNSTSSSVIMVEEFGNTGPAITPTLFTTYLVTINLSGFGIALQSGEQYVAAVIDPFEGPIGRGTLFRVIGSRATGFEDLFQQFDTDPNLYPGFLASQHNNPFQQYAAKLTLGNGDFDGDDDVDGHDFLAWQRHVGGGVAPEQDANGDGLADGRDLNIWQATFGTSWASASSANAAVPEPSGAALCLLAMLFFFHRRGHRGRRVTQIVE